MCFERLKGLHNNTHADNVHVTSACELPQDARRTLILCSLHFAGLSLPPLLASLFSLLLAVAAFTPGRYHVRAFLPFCVWPALSWQFFLESRAAFCRPAHSLKATPFPRTAAATSSTAWLCCSQQVLS